MSRSQFTCCVALPLAALPFGFFVNEAQRRPSSPALERPADVAPPAQPQAAVLFTDGRLTVNVKAQPLLEVLDRVSRSARIAIVPGEDLSRHRVSISFENVPLEEALHRLLAAYDAFFFYGVDKMPPARVRTIWVYSRGQGGRIAPVAPELWGSAKELRERLANGDAKDRVAAIAAMVEREGQRAYGDVAAGLTDADPFVRSQTLYAATNGGVEIPSEVLLNALADPSVDVRFLALQTLANGPAARTAAEYARLDANLAVRQLAEQVLRELNAKRPQ